MQKHSLKWEQPHSKQNKNHTCIFYQSLLLHWFPLARVSPYKLFLDLSFLDSHHQLMLSFFKYSFLGMVSATQRCFLFLVDPVSGPRILLDLPWSSPVFIQETFSHLLSTLCARLAVWTEGLPHFQLVLEAKIASVLDLSKHPTSPNLGSQVGSPLQILCDNSSHQNPSGE